MSILFRTKGWLTVNQLARAWAGELPGAEKEPKRFEQDLAHLLLEDAANGRLDDAGSACGRTASWAANSHSRFSSGLLGRSKDFGRPPIWRRCRVSWAPYRRDEGSGSNLCAKSQSAATLLVAKRYGRLTDDGARRHDWNVDIIVRHIRSKSSEPNFASEAGTCAKKVRADQASHEAGHSARPTYYRQARDHA